MNRSVTLLMITLLCWGVVSAQTPDVPQGTVCAFPTVLDSLRGETPECPTLGVPTVVLDEVSDRVEFSVPVAGGTSFDGVEGHFMMTIDGVEGTFLVQGTFNANHTQLAGSIKVKGDNAVSGLDLRDRTLHAAAVLTGCHPAGGSDPTSSQGVVSETVSYTVPAECLFVFGTSSYNRLSSGSYEFKTTFSGSKAGVNNYRFVIQNAAGNTVATLTGNVIGNTNMFTAVLGASAIASYAAGIYTAIPAVDPPYASCPSTGQPVTFEILPTCPSFDSLVVYTNGEQYQLRAYIDLSSVETRNPSFDIVATIGQYSGGSAWYVDSSRQYIATPMTALPAQQTVLQASASVESRCGVALVNDGYVTLTSANVTVTVPMACQTFYNTEDDLSGDSYRMFSHINLTGGYDYQHAHFVVEADADSTEVSATYSPGSLELATGWISTTQNFPWANKTITFYPVVELKCGLSMDSYVTVTGPTLSRSFVTCPTLGGVSLVSNHVSDPSLRADTLFVQVGNYNADLIHRVVFKIAPTGSSTTFEWVADGWSDVHGAAYKVLSLAMLQQLGLSTTNIVATVDVTLEVNANSMGCTNQNVYGRVVTVIGLPECPAFAGGAVTMSTKDYNGNITVSTPVQYYNSALIHHTGVEGQDSLFYTIYVNTSDMSVQGDVAGSIDAVYDVQNQKMTCTIPYAQLVPGARYDFVPHIHLTSYCNSESDTYVTIDGPSGSVVADVYCTMYGGSTVAVRNTDGSVTVTHQLVNYNPYMLNAQIPPRVFAYDNNNTGFKNSTNIVISADGLMTCTFTPDDLAARPSHNVTFSPWIYLSNTYCTTQPGFGPRSNAVCISYSDLPTFTAVSHSDGMGKTSLFKNEGVVLKAKITGSSAFAVSQVDQAGYLLSRSPITEYNADLAVLGTIGGTTGDTLSYKVGMDSCGGVTYYRPFLIMKGCDPQLVLGEQGSFSMWEPDFTVSASPTHVAAGGSVTLSAVATMTVGSWDQPTSSNGTPCEHINGFVNGCGINYTEDCEPTKNMEVWMYLLTGLRNCNVFWTNWSGTITNALGMDPGIAGFQYRWERNGSTFFVTTSVGAPGVTTDTPTSTTVYTGVSDFSYNGVHCIQRRNVTVAVP